MVVSKRSLFLALFISFFLMLQNGISFAAQKSGSLAQAEELFAQGKIQDAIQILNELVKQEPKNPEYQYSLGVAYERLKETDRAITHYLKAVQLNPGYTSALDNLGLNYIRKNKFDLAEKYLNQSVRVDPLHNPMSHYNLAMLYAMTSQMDKLGQEYEFLKGNFPNYALLVDKNMANAPGQKTSKNAPLQPVFNYNVVYQYGSNFQYLSPKGWVGVVQGNTSSGSPIYALPSEDRAIFLKYNPQKPEAGRTSSPMVEVQLYKNGARKSTSELLDTITSKLPKDYITTSPQAGEFKGMPTSTMEFQLIQKENGIDVHYRRKIFALGLDKVVFLFQLTSTESEYTEDVKTFEDSIQKIKFKGEIEEEIKTDSLPSSGKLRILSYTTKSGDVKTAEVLSETKDEYMLKGADGKFQNIKKSDMLNFKLS